MVKNTETEHNFSYFLVMEEDQPQTEYYLSWAAPILVKS